MARKGIDLTGQRFGRLVVIKEAEPDRYFYRTENRFINNSQLLCICDCGNEKIVLRKDVILGNTRSCGCLGKENRARINKNFVDNKVWEHDNALLFHERDMVEKGTKLTAIRPDRIQKNNKSGVIGVLWDKSRKKWRAGIKIKGNQIYLGRFIDKQDAINARKEAEEKYFKPILKKYEQK